MGPDNREKDGKDRRAETEEASFLAKQKSQDFTFYPGQSMKVMMEGMMQSSRTHIRLSSSVICWQGIAVLYRLFLECKQTLSELLDLSLLLILILIVLRVACGCSCQVGCKG